VGEMCCFRQKFVVLAKNCCFGKKLLDFGKKLLDFGKKLLDFGKKLLDFGKKLLDFGNFRDPIKMCQIKTYKSIKIQHSLFRRFGF
jgi:hypothetical protein